MRDHLEVVTSRVARFRVGRASVTFLRSRRPAGASPPGGGVSEAATEVGAPLFFAASLVALLATANIHRGSPAPMLWLLVTILGVSHSLALQKLPTARTLRRGLLYSCVLFVIAELAIGALAFDTALHATLSYDTWCDVGNTAASSAICHMLIGTRVAALS